MRILLPTATVLFSSLLTGQATYDGYGQGCPGTGDGPSVAESSNPQGGTNAIGVLTNEYCYGFTNNSSTPINVIGAQFFTSTHTLPTSTTGIAFYYGATTNGTTPATVRETLGEMEVGAAQAWYTGYFPQVQTLQPGHTCWIGQGDSNTIRGAGVSVGTPPALATYWRRPPLGTTAWSPTGIISNAAATLLVEGGNGVPNQPTVLTSTGVPTLGNALFELQMRQGAVGFPVTLLVGVSDSMWGTIPLPFDIGGLIGAPGCQVLASGDFMFGAGTTNASGIATFPLPVPNIQGLTGLSFYNQFYMLDPTANPGQLVVSNAGKGTIN